MNDEVLATISCAPENGVLQIREPTTIQERMLIRQSAKLAERDAEVAGANDRAKLLLEAKEHWRIRAEAAERAREEAVELMREVLERDRVRYLNGECVCINHSRKAELEYESGTCPHQRIAAFLAANGGRDHG